jgi:hypothetical protein
MDPALLKAYGDWMSQRRAAGANAPQPAAAPAPAARNRTAQLSAAAAPAPVISSMEAAPGTFDEKTGTYYHGGGMWASDKPLSGQQQQDQSQRDEFMRSAEKMAQRLGAPMAAVPVIAQYLQSEANKASAAISGQYGVQGHQISADANVRGHQISAGASMYGSKQSADATRYSADQNSAAARATLRGPSPVAEETVTDEFGNTRVIKRYGVPDPRNPNGPYISPITGQPMQQAGQGPSPAEIDAAVKRAGNNQPQRTAIAAKLRAAGIDPAQYGLK